MMKHPVLLVILSIFWTLSSAQESALADSTRLDAALLPGPEISAEPAPELTSEPVLESTPGFAPALVSGPIPVAAPTVRMTLNDCMSYAVEHSPAVRRQEHTNNSYRQDYIESIAALVPSVGATASAGASFGRSVNPETNTYSDISNFDNSYGISGQMPVFAGLSGVNTIRAAKVMRLMGVEELQQVRDQTALKAMTAYFDVVFYTEAIRLAREQLDASSANLRMCRKQFELGLKSAADVAEIEAQAASNDYLLTQQENALVLAMITLSEVMNYPADRSLEIVTDILIDTPAGAPRFEDVLANALDSNPLATAADYDLRRYKLNYSVARGRYFPTVSMGGGYSTNFFMSLDDRTLYPAFHNQFRDNRGYYFSASLNIPIFAGLSRRTSVNRARNDWRIAEERRAETLRSLQSEVAQAYQQMQGFGKEFVQATKKSAASELAYKAVEGKFQRGMVSALDLHTASNNLLQARSERLRARLQYILKSRLVEYYNGAPLIR